MPPQTLTKLKIYFRKTSGKKGEITAFVPKNFLFASLIVDPGFIIKSEFNLFNLQYLSALRTGVVIRIEKSLSNLVFIFLFFQLYCMKYPRGRKCIDTR